MSQEAQGPDNSEDAEYDDWNFLTRFLGGVFRGLVGGVVARLYWEHVVFTAGTVGFLSLIQEINIDWKRQRSSAVRPYNNFGFSGFVGMLVGLVSGVVVLEVVEIERQRAIRRAAS